MRIGWDHAPNGVKSVLSGLLQPLAAVMPVNVATDGLTIRLRVEGLASLAADLRARKVGDTLVAA